MLPDAHFLNFPSYFLFFFFFVVFAQRCVAQFLGQHYEKGDLTTFLDTFARDFAHRDQVDQIIGPDGGFAGTEASLDIEVCHSRAKEMGEGTEGKELRARTIVTRPPWFMHNPT